MFLTKEKKIKKSSRPIHLLSIRVNSFKDTAAIATPVKIHPIAWISSARLSLKSTFVSKAAMIRECSVDRLEAHQKYRLRTQDDTANGTHQRKIPINMRIKALSILDPDLRLTFAQTTAFSTE
jgi:hypothetical protein